MKISLIYECQLCSKRFDEEYKGPLDNAHVVLIEPVDQRPGIRMYDLKIVHKCSTTTYGVAVLIGSYSENNTTQEKISASNKTKQRGG